MGKFKIMLQGFKSIVIYKLFTERNSTIEGSLFGGAMFFALVVFLDIVVGNVTLDWGR